MKMRLVVTVDTELEQPLVVDCQCSGTEGEEQTVRKASFAVGEAFKELIETLTGKPLGSAETVEVLQ